MPPWKPSFGTFHAWLPDGSVVFVTVDQAATVGIGLDHPRAVSFMIKLKAPLENGLVSSTESPRLDEFEDALKAALTETAEPWLVGWRTERGRRFVFYYLPDKTPRPELDREWPHGYELRWRIANDPEWQEYRDNLAPTPFQQILINSNRLLFERDKLGDDARVERVVDHTLLFADASSAHAGAQALEQAGFALETVNGEVVTCTRQQDLAITTLERVIRQILEATETHGGRYDGWSASLQPTSTRRARPRRGLFGR